MIPIGSSAEGNRSHQSKMLNNVEPMGGWFDFVSLHSLPKLLNHLIRKAGSSIVPLTSRLLWNIETHELNLPCVRGSTSGSFETDWG